MPRTPAWTFRVFIYRGWIFSFGKSQMSIGHRLVNKMKDQVRQLKFFRTIQNQSRLLLRSFLKIGSAPIFEPQKDAQKMTHASAAPSGMSLGLPRGLL